MQEALDQERVLVVLPGPNLEAEEGLAKKLVVVVVENGTLGGGIESDHQGRAQGGTTATFQQQPLALASDL